MEILSTEIDMNGVVATVSGKTTRSQFISLFGDPEDVGGFSRKKKRGQILKYGETEFHFIGDKDSDTLFLIYREQLVVDERLPEISVRFREKL